MRVGGEGRSGGSVRADDGGFGPAAALILELGGVDQGIAAGLGAAAHRICPCSRATRGNIPVTVSAVAG